MPNTFRSCRKCGFKQSDGHAYVERCDNEKCNKLFCSECIRESKFLSIKSCPFCDSRSFTRIGEIGDVQTYSNSDAGGGDEEIIVIVFYFLFSLALFLIIWIVFGAILFVAANFRDAHFTTVPGGKLFNFSYNLGLVCGIASFIYLVVKRLTQAGKAKALCFEFFKIFKGGLKIIIYFHAAILLIYIAINLLSALANFIGK